MPNQHTVQPLEQRFWAKVDVRSPKDCWEWTAYKCSDGYGRMSVNNRLRRATHILFYLRKGYWPPKGRTCNHHCDNPGCLNPRHLYLGTKKSNARDMVQRGRANHTRGKRGRNNSLKGEQLPQAKLTRMQVWCIRALYRWGTTNKSELGRRFGVHRETISMIVHHNRGKHLWKHLPLTEHL